MHPLIKQLGFAGLLPFIGLNALVFTDLLPQSLIYLYFTQYSAVLLSFFGGIHWYDAISSKKQVHQLYVAMLPTIVGWLHIPANPDTGTGLIRTPVFLAFL